MGKKIKEKEHEKSELFSIDETENDMDFIMDLITSLDDENNNEEDTSNTKDAEEAKNTNISSVNKDVKEAEQTPIKTTRTRKLIIGVTEIATIPHEVNGIERHFPVLYGNFIETTVDDTIFQIDGKYYNKLLNDFLNSPRGLEYIRPTKKERVDAVRAVAEKIKKHKKENGNSSIIIYPKSDKKPVTVVKEEKLEDKGGQSNNDVQITEVIDDYKANERYDEIKKRRIEGEQINKLVNETKADRKKTRMTTITVMGIAVVIIAIVLFLVKDIIISQFTNIELELTDENITLKSGEPFNASNYVKYVTDKDNIYIIYPNLDTNELGKHQIEYVATNNFKSAKATLTVDVIDGTAPVLTLKQDELLLVRDRDEDTYDPTLYIDICEDNIDGLLVPKATKLDWNRNEQVITYQVFDSSKNQATAQMTVRIEDKAECVNHATYDPETNTCSCDDGYTGDGTEACKLVPKSSGTSNSGNSSSTGGGSGSSGSGTSSSGSSSSGSGSGGSTTPSTPTPPPAPSNPYINLSTSSLSFPVGTDMGTILNSVSSCVASYSGMSYSVSCSVDTTSPSSGGCSITADDGASAGVSVTIN